MIITIVMNTSSRVPKGYPTRMGSQNSSLSSTVFEKFKVEPFVGAVVFHHGEDDLDISLFERIVNVGLTGAEHGNDSLVFVDGELASNRIEGGFGALVVKVRVAETATGSSTVTSIPSRLS